FYGEVWQQVLHMLLKAVNQKDNDQMSAIGGNSQLQTFFLCFICIIFCLWPFFPIVSNMGKDQRTIHYVHYLYTFHSAGVAGTFLRYLEVRSRLSRHCRVHPLVSRPVLLGYFYHSYLNVHNNDKY